MVRPLLAAFSPQLSCSIQQEIETYFRKLVLPWQHGGMKKVFRPQTQVFLWDGPAAEDGLRPCERASQSIRHVTASFCMSAFKIKAQ